MTMVFVWQVVKCIGVILAIPIGLMMKDRDQKIYQTLHDLHADLMLNAVSTLFMTKMFFIKICGESWTIHSLFEQVVFYGGGFITLFWGAFRIKLAYLDHKLKKEQLDAIKKDNALKDAMIKDFDKNMGEVNHLKKHINKENESV